MTWAPCRNDTLPMTKKQIRRVIRMTKAQQYDYEMQLRGLEKAVREAMETGCRSATAYISDSMVAKATRRFKPDARNKRVEFVVKMGAPNFLERRFIRLCMKAGMMFPLRQVQLRWWPKGK